MRSGFRRLMHSSFTRSSTERSWRIRQWVPMSPCWSLLHGYMYLFARDKRLGQAVSETLFLINPGKGLSAVPISPSSPWNGGRYDAVYREPRHGKSFRISRSKSSVRPTRRTK